MTFGETDPSEIHGGASAPARPRPQVTFDRRELNRILGLYGRMVAAGEWRDYAIDFLKDRAVFSVFRRSSEVPIYRIEKNPKLARRQGAYSVMSATGLIVRRGHELDRVLRALDKSLEAGRGVAAHRCSRGRVRKADPDPALPGLRPALRRRRGARAERALHQHAVEPAVELVADVLERADHAKAGGAVQLDRRRLRRIADHRDHLAEAAALAFLDQALEQRAADAAALRVRGRRRSNPRR